ncbi:activating signal cointegrator 1-like [Antedon mediterranea]|uniref:activating signal cointegrator 1-like n=1 Tax=Antedon mediterranea TaxID=105859 RepID=UPI003AF6EB33
MAVVINKEQNDLFQWCCQQFVDILDLDSPQDIVHYLLSMSKELDLLDYLNDLLDKCNSKHNSFITELTKRWRTINTETCTQDITVNHSSPSNMDVPENAQIYRKPAVENSLISSSNNSKGHKERQEKEKKPGEFVKVDLSLLRHEPKMPGDDKKSELDQFLQSCNKQGARKKQKHQQKFVPLYSNEGEAKDTVHLPGRHACECQAQKHALISNCLVCGRVVCAQEGSGPCLFCGNLVCTREEQEILSRNSNKSEKVRRKLMGEKHISNTDKQKISVEKAIKNKNRLIEYDRTSVKRTQVIDDESDYFATDTNQWLTDKERQLLTKRESELREQRHGSRLNKKITFDFAGRKVVDSAESINMYDRNDAVVKAVNFGTDLRKTNGVRVNDLVNPAVKSQLPKFVSQVKPPKPSGSSLNLEANRSKHRIQDRELQEMSDEGMCLSMHQPWASLFVHGIKKHEGRTWYTAHRGRLWIAATAKMPSTEEINELESFYQCFYEDIDIAFPGVYPSACLLGCVDVIDCLSQDQYRVNFPDGESSSPYVIIAENFQELVVKFPIKGQHKIWKLTNDIHSAAKKGLRSVPKV